MMLTEDDVMQAYMDSDLDTDWMLFEMVKFANAVIAANNAKVLADLKPVTDDEVDAAYEKWWSSQDHNLREPQYYSAGQVAALIQERDALAARVKELEAQSKQAIKDALEEAAKIANRVGDGSAALENMSVQELTASEIRKLKDQL